MPRLRAMRAATLIGLVLLLCACSSTSPRPGQRPLFNDPALRTQLRTLSSDRFEGRRPGTAGAAAAVDDIVAQLRRFGLRPGNGASYLQTVPLVEITPSEVRLSVSRAGGRSRPIAAPSQMVVWTPRASGAGVLRHSPVVFAGYGIDATEVHWNDYAGIDVRGKTVVVLAGVPPAWAGGASASARRDLDRYGLGRYKFAQAAKRGAAGILVVDVGDSAGESWQAIVNRAAGGILEPPPSGSSGRTALEGWIRGATAHDLFKDAGADFAAAARRAGRAGFRALPLDLRADGAVKSQVRRFTSPNVIAIVAGHGRSREYVVYTAHWDGLGHGGGRERGVILPGAVDDASGVAGLLLLAHAFASAEPRPDRTIVFLATTAGEYGSLGARYYAAHPLYPLRDTVADIDLEMLRIGGPTRDISSLGLGQSQLDRYLASAADLQGRVVHGDPEPWRGLFFRSDAQRFAERGVPALYAVGGIDDAAMGPGWGKARLDDYFAHRYLRAADEYSKAWDLRGTLVDLRLYRDVGMRLARASGFPLWNPDSDYRRRAGASGG